MLLTMNTTLTSENKLYLAVQDEVPMIALILLGGFFYQRRLNPKNTLYAQGYSNVSKP
jgi:hypothetical protein